MDILGKTLDLIGKLLIGFTAIRVHHRVLHEHKIDEAVFKSMKKEQRFGILGIVFLVAGFIIQLLA
ncbi:MAG: hypothetical protein A3C80_00865 [Candidatus Ryanbacteria bacterium RIFCSPHIGHO2_02_FULL_45_43]|uniref:Uncharacterized protein n=1 Tax=Candidatus Ryanbacteria bacterium RIFCSPHIGHO2_01_45_13 TaxID=1802112 RepID=A0A1G2FZ69_9BACT|nr:MAG: hypothetical protein A2718_03975 [Candidatus Ryanbacteria bacterium RIFCSPHIGHO2_01_FULL_44_130]OGZ43346.1 MAG: hypothetical protein A2W41_04475 [Candidatus Ryanbacteria bacterium RIFCSPHIGHO2_01_45_13]OGZ48930.1 MAG: hypothetical protein A3C80_00865 [Candidatus Ryanbacteria bacterium RIFCSPHIGHO2_02_FULL_45_43]OGZ50899.1 MAG: hypothetical protein A3E55_02950 [Candidatus Ryanbacteria bacterium RIFCSPHIGHO2_12_FULL_44_20]OGZ51746.1 MAG: hypothetical protein A3A17_00050 [Candidatus Ryanba